VHVNAKALFASVRNRERWPALDVALPDLNMSS
jgi:hypothetical protein